MYKNPGGGMTTLASLCRRLWFLYEELDLIFFILVLMVLKPNMSFKFIQFSNME